MIRREEWGARPPASHVALSTPVRYVVIHHTAMPPAFTVDDGVRGVKEIQDFHMDERGWDDIGYRQDDRRDERETKGFLNTLATMRPDARMQIFFFNEWNCGTLELLRTFLVGEDGSVYEGRGWDRVGAHALNYNTRSIGISILGNFM
ncbi:unnamed protein product, partial [Darwinula stevensoni]